MFFTLPTLQLVVPAHTSIKQTLVCGNLLCALWHNQSKPSRHTRTRLHAATHAPVLFRHGDSGTHHLPLRGHNISAIREEELHPKSQHCSEDKNYSNILSDLFIVHCFCEMKLHEKIIKTCVFVLLLQLHMGRIQQH